MILVTGPPRSGTSMVAGILAICGAFPGFTIGPVPHNAKGTFQNQVIMELIINMLIAFRLYNEWGMHVIPERSPFIADLRERVDQTLLAQGANGLQMMVKAPQISLMWETWHQAYPEAKWIWCDRDKEAVARSCIRAAKYESLTDPPYNFQEWKAWVEAHDTKLFEIAEEIEDFTIIDSRKVADGDYDHLKSFVDYAGLVWKEEEINEFVDKGMLTETGRR